MNHDNNTLTTASGHPTPVPTIEKIKSETFDTITDAR